MSNQASSGYSSGSASNTGSAGNISYDNNSKNSERTFNAPAGKRKRQQKGPNIELTDLSTVENGDTTSTDYSMIDESKVKKKKRQLPNVPREPSGNKVIRKPRRRKCTIVLMIVSLLVLLAAGAAVFLWRTCKLEVFCKGEKPTPPTSGSCLKHIKDVIANTTDSFECVVSIIDPTALLLILPNGENLTMPITDSVINTTNLMESKINVTINKTDVQIIMKEVDCSLNGHYTVTITNNTHHDTFELTVNVIPGANTSFCPCDVSRYLGLDGEIECQFLNVLEDKQSSLTIRKNKSGEVLFEDVTITDLVTTSVSGTTLTVTTKDNGGVLVTLQMSSLTCSDDDVYVFEIGNSTYTTKFHVESEQRIPVITTEHNEQGGLWHATDTTDAIIYPQELECEAKTGCFQATPKLYRREDSEQFKEITENIRLIHDEPNYEGLGKGFRLKLSIENNDLKRDFQFKCSYQNEIDGQMESDVFTALALPENVCNPNNTIHQCNIPHPYVCEKYVTCGLRPRQRSCPFGLHWFQSISKHPCNGGYCENPDDAKCSIDNGK